MRKFRKRPIVVEAIQATGSPESNREIIDWARGSKTPVYMDTLVSHFDDGSVLADSHQCLSINTLKGTMWVNPGDWIIKDVNGEFYPCKDTIFQATYEPVAEGE